MPATLEVASKQTKKANSGDLSARLVQELEQELRAKRDELRAHLERHRTEVAARGTPIPDDFSALANEDFLQDMARDTLERERQTLREIELALERIRRGEYGVCESCGEEISPRRLQALPWARFCLRCAEQRQTASGESSE